MARIRTIKPEFWVDEKIVELSPMARLLFIGLWNFCDDYGRMEYSEKKVKMQIFPSDSVEVSALIGEIRREKLVEMYTIENKEYLSVKNFDKHQKIDKRSAPKYPDKDGTIPNPAESRRVLDGNSLGREGKGKERNRENTTENRKRFVPPTQEQVSEYCRERGNSIDADHFVNFYQARGWKTKSGPIKDWRAAVRTWEKNDPRPPAEEVTWN